MGWHPYHLDKAAQRIVLAARGRDNESLNQAYKMRATCAYGLERFWGEHLRLAESEPHKAAFVKDVWCAFAEIMARAKIAIPKTMASREDAEREIARVADRLWSLPLRDQQVSLAVLTNLCDAVVWWTQRLKQKSKED